MNLLNCPAVDPAYVERWIAWLLSSEALGVYSLDEIRALDKFLRDE